MEIDRVVTLDELLDSVPEDLVREAETRSQSSSFFDEDSPESTTESENSMSKDLSKAQRIRNYMDANPEARNKDVVEALKQHKVTAADVANVKSISKRGGKEIGRPAKESTKPRAEKAESTAMSATGASITLPELEAGVAFVKAAGSVMRAKHLLIIIEQIKAC